MLIFLKTKPELNIKISEHHVTEETSEVAAWL